MRIPIAQMKVYDWQGPQANVKFRVVANQSFLARDNDDSGFQVDANPKVFREVDCTFAVEVIDGVNVNVLTVPALWLFSTTDAIVNRQARYSAYYYSASGGKIRDAAQLQTFQLQRALIDVFNPVPWKEIIRANNPAAPIPFDVSTFSREQILEIIGGGAVTKGPQAATPRVAYWSGPITVNGAPDWEFQDADPQVVLRSRNTAWNTSRIIQSASNPNNKTNNKPALQTLQTTNHSALWNLQMLNDAATHRWGFSVRDSAVGLHLESYDSSPALTQGFRFDPSGGLGVYDEQDAGVGFLFKGATGFFHLGIEAAGGAASAATKEITFTTSGVGINKSSAIGSQLHVVSGAAARTGFIVDTAASPSQPIAILRNNTAQRFLFDNNANAEFGLASSVKGRLTFAVAGNANKTSLEAADTPASSVVYKMPAADPVSGQLLRTNTFSGGVAVLEWVNPSAGGDVSSDIGTTVDNRLARFQSTTGKLITDSAIVVADTSGSFSVPDDWTVTSAGGSSIQVKATGEVFTTPTRSATGQIFDYVAGSQTQAGVSITVARFSTTYNQTTTAASDDLLFVRTETGLGSGQHNFIRGLGGAAGSTARFRIDSLGNYYFGASGGIIGDNNGNEYLKFTTVASAVNEFTFSNAATGGRPKLEVTGGDTNIPLELAGKGTGNVFLTSDMTISKATPQIRWTHTGLSKNFIAVINGSGQLVIGEESISNAITINNTDGIVTFSAIPVLPASDPTTSNQATRKSYVDNRKISFNVSWLIADPSSCPVNTDFGSFGVWLVPGGGSYTATKAKIVFRSGSHTTGGDLVFKIHSPSFGDLGSMGLNNSNNAINTVYVDNFADQALSEDNIFIAYLLSRSGTITEKNVACVLEGFRTSF